MSGDRRKEIVRHTSEDDLDRLLAETDDEKVRKRLTFVKNLYKVDALEEAADRVGKSTSTDSYEYTRKRAHQLGIDLALLPVGSPDLNPIKQVWKRLKWVASRLMIESAAEFRAPFDDLFEQLTNRLSFAKTRISEFLGSPL